jgi:hypothetical protein
MRRSHFAAIGLRSAAFVTAIATLVPAASAEGVAQKPSKPIGVFRHLSTFDVIAGNGSAVAEIVDFSFDERQLVYTDAPSGQIGFVDISAPGAPVGQGTLDVGGEPTSLIVREPWVLVAVNTSASFTEPSGDLVVVRRADRQIVARLPLGGQPDAIALAPDRKRAAIVIENERDEDFADGLLPQPPSGRLVVAELKGSPTQWAIREVDLSPVAAAAANGQDLEPEFVDVNDRNLAVVTFQENNHIAVVDLVKRAVVSHFPAGSAELSGIDVARNGAIELTGSLLKRREPDAVAWIDRDSFATANEGDYEDADGIEGGSRGFTIFNVDGTVELESGGSFETWLVRAGHHNESRAGGKGNEPEGLEMGTFGGRRLLFVGSERANAVGVYDVTGGQAAPLQILPTGIRPEGLKAAARRGLFAASTEAAAAAVGIPTMITLYGLAPQPIAEYPTIEAADEAGTPGLPVPWAALSGLVGDPSDPNTLYAVSDSALARGYIYTLDVSARPARIVRRLEVTGATGLDLEGIAVGPDGNFWVASEGTAATTRNRVLKVDRTSGVVLSTIALPDALETGRRSNGYEGLAVAGSAGAEVVYVAIQRAWLNGTGDTDGDDTKLGRYDVATGAWGFVHYPFEPIGGGDWIGLSEITLLPDGRFALIERDKGWGPTTGFNAELKALFQVDLAGAEFRSFDDPNGLVTVEKTLLRDLLPDLAENSIWTPEKVEGFAVGADGRAWAVTDNDGLSSATGETLFLDLGALGDF